MNNDTKKFPLYDGINVDPNFSEYVERSKTFSGLAENVLSKIKDSEDFQKQANEIFNLNAELQNLRTKHFDILAKNNADMKIPTMYNDSIKKIDKNIEDGLTSLAHHLDNGISCDLEANLNSLKNNLQIAKKISQEIYERASAPIKKSAPFFLENTKMPVPNIVSNFVGLDQLYDKRNSQQ